MGWGLRYWDIVTDSFGLGEVNAEEKPELFYCLPGSVETGRVNGTLLLLGFPRLGLRLTLLGLICFWFTMAGFGTPPRWAPIAYPIPRFHICCGLTFDSSRAEPTWSCRASSNSYKPLLRTAGSLGFSVLYTGLWIKLNYLFRYSRASFTHSLRCDWVHTGLVIHIRAFGVSVAQRSSEKAGISRKMLGVKWSGGE